MSNDFKKFGEIGRQLRDNSKEIKQLKEDMKRYKKRQVENDRTLMLIKDRFKKEGKMLL